MSDPVDLVVSGLTVRYADLVAVQETDLSLQAGHFLAVTGPSGAGKTSLLWALAGATAPATGSVLVGGVPVGDRATASALGVVVVPQGNGLASALTASENVLVPLLAAGVEPSRAVVLAREALDLVGLEDSGGHLVEELSGGQQQRVALARSLAAPSTVLLADEPTSDLDAANRERMVAALRSRADAGVIVVMSTHDPEAAAAADGELGLDEGRPHWVRTLSAGSGVVGDAI